MAPALKHSPNKADHFRFTPKESIGVWHHPRGVGGLVEGQKTRRVFLDSARGGTDNVPQTICRPNVVEACMMDLNGEPGRLKVETGSPLRSII